ncbi:hypothetical protein ABBQ32_004076 [Trebouxia sp. C0010 RCD-2024]
MGAAESTEAAPPSEATATPRVIQTAQTFPSALVVCGPSGVGKGTLIKQLMASSDKFGFSCSHTTRLPRAGEKEGVEYHFTTREKFEKGIEDGKFLEHATVHNNLYGTSIRAVQNVAAAGKCCILDIDVQGARQVRKRSDQIRAIFVFLKPPSFGELEKRLRGRGTESEEQIQTRLATSKVELDSLSEPGLWDYVVTNETMEGTGKQLVDIAGRALAGQIGNGIAELQDPDVSQTLANQTGPSTTQQRTAAAEAASGGPVVAPAAAVAPAAMPSGDADKQSSSKPAVPSATALLPVPTVQTASGFERWRGKVALVTGASAGIGWAICEALATAGVKVVAVARRRERLEALQQSLVEQGVPISDFLPVVCDITKEAEVIALPRIIVKRWREAGVDILVNNAGMGRDDASLMDGNTASWVEMVSTNTLGVCMCTREAVQDMKRRGQWGHIIHISSMSAHRVPSPADAFYAATKHALRALAEGLRQEAREQDLPLRVTCISPGTVQTEFFEVSSFGNKDAGKSKYAAIGMKPLQAYDIASAVVWCLTAPDHMDVNDILIRPTAQRS